MKMPRAVSLAPRLVRRLVWAQVWGAATVVVNVLDAVGEKLAPEPEPELVFCVDPKRCGWGLEHHTVPATELWQEVDHVA